MPVKFRDISENARHVSCHSLGTLLGSLSVFCIVRTTTQYHCDGTVKAPRRFSTVPS
eukprot:m.255618 g.255618  ORF g.255618 m.255618 type:complete len:57 (+) comp15947_c0_seq12:3621-3791(+)